MGRIPGRLASLASTIVAFSATASGQSGMHGYHEAGAGDEPLDTVDFRVSCAYATQPAFDRALSFMHHMIYEQARSAFA